MSEILPVSTNGDSQPLAAISAISLPNHSFRIQSLDVLRGVAVLGGLLIGIWIFGGFSFNKQVNLQINPHGWNYRMYATVTLLFEGKMLALISFVFGAGLIIFMAHKNKFNNLPAADVFIRRQMWLIAFGLVNALLFLSTGDVLFHLGIMGILLFPFIRLSVRGLLIAAIITSLIFSGKNYWSFADDHARYDKYMAAKSVERKIERDSLNKRKKDSITIKQGGIVKTSTQKKDTLTKQQQDDKKAWEGTIKNMKYDPEKDDGNIKSMRAIEFGKVWEHLLPSIQSREAQWTYRTGIWDIAAMMFLGMALLKFGFFSNQLSPGQYLLLALSALTIGILLSLFRMYFSAGVLIDYGRYIRHHWFPYNLLYPFEKAFMVLGYASLVVLFVQRKILSGLCNSLARVGQMALSNYLLQSIVCTLFFTGYGMGYFGRLSQFELYIVVAEIWIVQILLSVLWMKRFAYGPAEWLLRCLSYGTWLSIKKAALPGNIETSPIIF
jgi:uncharacterized protein